MTKDDTNDYYNYEVKDRQEKLLSETPLPPRKKLFIGLEKLPSIHDVNGLLGLLRKKIYALASVRKRYTENLAHTPVHYTTALAHIRPRYTENLAHTPLYYKSSLANVRQRYTENLAHTPVQGIEPLVDIPDNTYMNRRKQRYHFEW